LHGVAVVEGTGVALLRRVFTAREGFAGEEG
jgi:hypothetical protein